MTRVAVTGMGAVTPLGATALSSFEALVAGRTGVARTSFPLDEQQYESRIAAEVRDVDIAGVLGAREARRHGRYTQLALVALKEALADAGWDAMRYERHRLASILGVGFGGLEALEEAAETAIRRGARRVSPFGITMLVPNMAAGQIATVAAAHGPCWATATACASGAHAIGQAVRLLRDGTVDAVITGGAEACVTPLALAGFARMGALSTRNDDPLRAARPFDRDRDGFVIGEGAALLVLEREEDAHRRGATIHGFVRGAGASADGFHPTQPDPEGRGAVASMRAALDDARITPESIGYVNAHGTGTKYNDAIEGLAISRAFGAHARDLLVSSTKGGTGHMLGAGGAFEALVCLLAMQRGVVPPTLNLENPDGELGLDLVPLVSREKRISAALSNSFGFGGQNASLVLERA